MQNLHPEKFTFLLVLNHLADTVYKRSVEAANGDIFFPRDDPAFSHQIWGWSCPSDLGLSSFRAG